MLGENRWTEHGGSLPVVQISLRFVNRLAKYYSKILQRLMVFYKVICQRRSRRISSFSRIGFSWSSLPCFILFCLIFTDPVAGQYVSSDPFIAPAFAQLDERGVDLSRGILETRIPGVSIGSGDRALYYELRSKGGYFFPNNLNMNDNWSMFVVTGVSCGQSGNCLYVDLRDQSVMFQYLNPTYARYYACCSSGQSPDSIVNSGGSFVYTSREGDLYTFTTSVAYSSPSNVLHNVFFSNGRVYLLNSIKRKSGEQITIYYSVYGGYIRK